MGDRSYIIVGAGVFGASTALNLISKYPEAQVTLIDRGAYPCERAGSCDWNKVVRTDYLDVLYTKLSLEAKELWTTDPLYKPHYHPTGMTWISSDDLSHIFEANYKQLGVEVPFRVVSVEEARGLYGGVFAQTDFTGVDKVFVNPEGGWAQARDAVKNVIKTAIEAGVRFLDAQVESLVLDGFGACTGVKTEVDGVVSASHTILANGAGLPKLLADSAPDRVDFQTEPRLMVAAVATALASKDSDVSSFVNSSACGKENGLKGGFIPPAGDSPLKFWVDVSFKNTILHSSGRRFSTPPGKWDYDQWNVPEALKRELETVVRDVVGPAGRRIDLDTYRICWELTTPTEDWVMSPHGSCPGLYIATAGSFHSFKMLPILGKYAVKMLDGKLEPDLAKRWAFQREMSEPGGRGLYPARELEDL